jgi:hypothetical protein
VAATLNDTAASAHVLDCSVGGRSQRKQKRIFLMNHIDGWMDGWMDGRTDVDLCGTRRTGGGYRRDQESDQEKNSKFTIRP